MIFFFYMPRECNCIQNGQNIFAAKRDVWTKTHVPLKSSACRKNKKKKTFPGAVLYIFQDLEFVN